MNIRNKFLWFAVASSLITLLVISIVAILFWNQLTLEEKNILLKIGSDYFIYIFSGILLLIGIVVFILDSLFHIYIIPITRLIENAGIIRYANPSHRLRVEGSKEIERLAELINEGAEKYETLLRHVEGRIRLATAETEAEKNILAAILKELPQGVLICNLDGRILLYNNLARTLLIGTSSESGSGDENTKFIGLGRSIFGIVDKGCIVHALDEISARLETAQSNPTIRFVITGTNGNLLKTEAIPVLDTIKRLTGFILLLQDITNQIQREGQIVESLKRLTTGLRQPSAGIRSAIETVMDYPDLEQKQIDRLISVVHEESMTIGRILDEETTNSALLIKSDWPGTQMRARDFADSLVRKAKDQLGIRLVSVSINEEDCWMMAESYSLMSALLHVIRRLVTETETETVWLKVGRSGNLIEFDLTWEGTAVRMETLRSWCGERPGLNSETLFLYVGEIFKHHDAEIFSYSDPSAREKAGLRVYLPEMAERQPIRHRPATILPESRPEFYDFDMFNQPGQLPEVAGKHLEDLTLTVFDTETTGLHPAGGDEIISIGAVRIVNQRLLREETFEQLIDPKRDLPEESIAVHGIHPEMLSGQPVITEVLPRFYEFAKDTVLVAHNAAFDMRMLQMKEPQTGIRFINPVLDTLLLSAVVHPAAKDHNMESIAARLGIRIIGRHTALGDAIVAGEIFLSLVPLLIQKGIRTLEDAVRESKKTYYARLKY